MNLRNALFSTLILTLSLSTLTAQTITMNYFRASDYKRSPLFLEQDRISGLNFFFKQGLEIISVQDKVRTDIKGLGIYYTPVDLDGIPIGEYNVSMSKTGYYPSEFRVSISPEGRTSVEVDLKPLVTKIIVADLPENAIVYINNNKIDGREAYVPLGEASIRITAFGYEDFFSVININETEQQVFKAELQPKEFALTEMKSDRKGIWLSDSPSMRKIKYTVTADAPGSGHYTVIRHSDGMILEETDFVIEASKTSIIIDGNNSLYATPGDYTIEVSGTDSVKTGELTGDFSISEGTRVRWRNVFAASGGFLYCPDSRILPAGLSQVQTGFTAAFNTDNMEDLNVPAQLSFRSALSDRLEISGGTALYLSPAADSGSFDIYASGKFVITGLKSTDFFSLSALFSVNYNGLVSDFGTISAYDPFGGVSGLAIAFPAGISVGGFSFILSPEIRFSPSYPMTVQGGFSSGEFHIWNYIRGAVFWDRGIFSAALSAALQSPSYLGAGNKWPFYGGLDLSLTPGRTGFSFSLFGGFRYSDGDPVQISAGASAGFMF